MKLIKNAVAELISIFVDDPLFAILIIAWTVVVYFGRNMMPRAVMGPSLFLGLAVLLVVFTCRQALRIKSKA